jgi:antitoxin VapB
MSRVKEVDGQQPYRAEMQRLIGSAPWMRAKDVRHYTAKVFKSGNSLALRLPAGLGLSAGMEMDLRVEDGEAFSFAPVDRPKRKFAVGEIWGSAEALDLIAPEDRLFQPRDLIDFPERDEK